MRRKMGRYALRCLMNDPIRFAIAASFLPIFITSFCVIIMDAIINFESYNSILDIGNARIGLWLFVFFILNMCAIAYAWFIALVSLAYQCRLDSRLKKKGRFYEGHIEKVKDPLFLRFGQAGFKVRRVGQKLGIKFVWLD